jgi:DNA-binding response OmpR family regulator
MATVVLALGDRALRALCEAELSRAGHSTVIISRALAVLQVSQMLAPQLVLIDDTALGRDTLRAAAGLRLAGVGLDDDAMKGWLPLPLSGWQVVDLVERLAGAAPNYGVLALDPARRVARANGREVDLTRTEFRLLEALYGHRGRELTQDEALEAAWGIGEWSGNLSVLRAHVRNLRLKLAQVGLPNAVRSVRGRGYALAE